MIDATTGSKDGDEILIGAQVRCTSGACGSVIRVVVDPVTMTLTHLVVEPSHRKGLGRLVPMSLLVEPRHGEPATAPSTPDDVLLTCSAEEFDKLDAAEETRFFSGRGAQSGYGAHQVMYWPYYAATMGAGSTSGMGFGVGNTTPPITYDVVPLGEVTVSRGDPVHATDGAIGHVEGLLVDHGSRHVSHVLLREGHLFGKKDVAIPIGAVTKVGDTIELDLNKDEVGALPAVPVDR